MISVSSSGRGDLDRDTFSGEDLQLMQQAVHDVHHNLQQRPVPRGPVRLGPPAPLPPTASAADTSLTRATAATTDIRAPVRAREDEAERFEYCD